MTEKLALTTSQVLEADTYCGTYRSSEYHLRIQLVGLETTLLE